MKKFIAKVGRRFCDWLDPTPLQRAQKIVDEYLTPPQDTAADRAMAHFGKGSNIEPATLKPPGIKSRRKPRIVK